MNGRVDLPQLPTWLAMLPFLTSARARSDSDLIPGSALASAAAAMAADPARRDSRSRISFLLAELATQYGRRTGDHSGWIGISRHDLARAARIDLTKVKRILSFLSLSGVIEIASEGIRVIDWSRLCELGSYDHKWVAAPMTEATEPAAPPLAKEHAHPAVTTAGDPASFV